MQVVGLTISYSALLAVALTLVFAGTEHIIRPTIIRSALEPSGSPVLSRTAPYVLGTVETGTGVTLLLTLLDLPVGRPWSLWVAPTLFLGYTVLLWHRLGTHTGAPCGCSRYGRVSRTTAWRSLIYLALSIVGVTGATRLSGWYEPHGSFLSVFIIVAAGVSLAVVLWEMPEAIPDTSAMEPMWTL